MFNKGIRLGRIWGIPIRLDYSWFIIFALLTYQFAQQGFEEFGYRLGGMESRYWVSAITAFLLLASILLHELGHAYIALRKGIAIRSITLFIFGGVAEIMQEPRTPGEEFEIAAAGPLVSIAIAAVAWSLITLNKPFPYFPLKAIFVLSYLAKFNFSVVIFNLIPGFPLDGGRIFRAALWKQTGNLRKSTRIATFMGQTVGYFIIFVGIFFLFSYPINSAFLFLIGMFLIQAAQSSYQQVLVRSALSGIKVKEIMSQPVSTVNSWLTIDELINDYFLRYRYSCFPVKDDGVLKGFVILQDTREIPRLEWMNRRVADILHPIDDNSIVSDETDAVDALTKMIHQDFHKLFVMQNNEIVGIITLSDVMSLLKMKTDLGQ